MGNHPRENFPQENYNGEDTLHSNRRCSDRVPIAVEEEEPLFIENTKRPI